MSRPLRIVHTPPRYYPYIGGVEELCRGFARQLARQGHDVRVICADAGPPLPVVDGVPVRRTATAAYVANTNVTPALPLHLLRVPADVFHTYLPTPWSADWTALIGRLRRIPVVVSYLNDIVGAGPARIAASSYNRAVLPATLRLATAVHVLTERYAASSPHLRQVGSKVVVLPPGVDTERYAPDAGPRWPSTFFFLSLLDQYHRYKGLDVLLRAVARARGRVPEVRLIVGGRGPLLEEYRGLAESLGIAGAVEFRGYVPDDELLRHYRRCTAFALPSTRREQEGFGLVALEAMSTGAPVIASDVIGLAEDVASIGAGRIVPAGDSEALAGALVDAARGALASAGAWGRVHAMANYAWPVIGARLEALYRRLVDARPA